MVSTTGRSSCRGCKSRFGDLIANGLNLQHGTNYFKSSRTFFSFLLAVFFAELFLAQAELFRRRLRQALFLAEVVLRLFYVRLFLAEERELLFPDYHLN